MKKALAVAVSLGLLASVTVAHAQELSWEARGALAEANLASKDRTPLLSWRLSYRGDTNLAAAFDTKYDTVLRPQYGSGTHVDGSRLYLGLTRDGALVGGLTPFGADPCSTEAMGRELALSAYFGSKLVPIKLAPLERLQFTQEGGAEQTVCYYPFHVSATEMDRNFAGLGDSETMRFTVRVDDRVNHSVWTGSEYTAFERGSAKTSQSITAAQYRGMRETLPLLPE